jgi:two-component system, NtrC family, response regulator AtoC
MKPRVLIIDDEANLVSSVAYGLSIHGFESVTAATASEGLAQLREHRPQAVLLDQRLPDAAGIDIIMPIRSSDPNVAIVMISAHGDIPTAVEAVRRGAHDFVTKPFDLDDLAAVLRTALTPAGRRHTRPQPEHAPPPEVSPVMRELRATIATVARSSARIVLLLGPSGVGKGFTANAIHDASARADGPFTIVNCAALPGDLLEAELFGVERGAYTGAALTRPGLVETAAGGTLFLDEIGEMPLALQAKLLRFLESRCYRHLGSDRERVADVRVIAASNRDLAEEVAAGHFRSDLFYRLNIVPITLPRLAERREDVLPLARHFAARAAEFDDAPPITFSPAAAAALAAHAWPGNIRELANLVERLTILHPGQEIDLAALPPEICCGAASMTSAIEVELERTEREILGRALRAANGHKGKAAEALGVSRHALKRRLKRIGLS